MIKNCKVAHVGSVHTIQYLRPYGIVKLSVASILFWFELDDSTETTRWRLGFVKVGILSPTTTAVYKGDSKDCAYKNATNERSSSRFPYRGCVTHRFVSYPRSITMTARSEEQERRRGRAVVVSCQKEK